MNPSALREDLRRHFNETCLDLDSSPPSELHHYTCPAAFRNIITSQRIWCTDICRVNDTREGDCGLEVIRSVVQRKSVPREFLEAIASSGDLFGLKRICTSYISSFASGLEQPRMWTEYAARGSGCAIIFDYGELLTGAVGGENYALVQMLYDRQAQLAKVEQIVDFAIQLQRHHSLSSHDAIQFWIEEVAFSLFNFGMMCKDTRWSPERESRIVVFDGENVAPFLDENKRLRVALPFARGAIVRVVRGPEARNDLQVECIQEMLRQAGYAKDLPIVDAKCGIRPS